MPTIVTLAKCSPKIYLKFILKKQKKLLKEAVVLSLEFASSWLVHLACEWQTGAFLS